MKYFLLFTFCFVLSACSKEDIIIDVTLPYFENCNVTVDKVMKNFELINKSKDGLFSIDVQDFDVIPISHSEMAGYVVISYKGSGERKKEGYVSPEEYLIGTANGIIADCMPNNRVELDFDINDEYLNVMLRGKKYPHIKREGENLILFYNGGEYEYQ